MQNQVGNMRLIRLGDGWQFRGYKFTVLNNAMKYLDDVKWQIAHFPDPREIPGDGFMDIKGLTKIEMQCD